MTSSSSQNSHNPTPASATKHRSPSTNPACSNYSRRSFITNTCNSKATSKPPHQQETTESVAQLHLYKLAPTNRHEPSTANQLSANNRLTEDSSTTAPSECLCRWTLLWPLPFDFRMTQFSAPLARTRCFLSGHRRTRNKKGFPCAGFDQKTNRARLKKQNTKMRKCSRAAQK